MKNVIHVILFALLFFVFHSSSNGQVFLNNGGIVDARPGSYIHVNGSLQNDSGLLSVGEDLGINSELTVTGDIINNALAEGEGHIVLYGDWFNNNIFNSYNGTVFFAGGDQLLSGTTETQFYNLFLEGSGLKTQTIDKYVNGILELNHLELQTEDFTMFVENSDINAVQRTTGFVSSLGEGSLSRNTSVSDTYLFPVGSSVGVNRYRPVEIEPLLATNNTYTVRLANVEAGTEGYNRDFKEDIICETNSEYYHRINRSAGSSAIDLKIFFDEVMDGIFDGIANWTDYPQWEIVTGSNTTQGTPLSSANVDNWDTFNETPYILYIEDHIINAGDDVTVCANNPEVNLNASFSGSGTVTWTGGNGTFTPNENALNATYIPSSDEISSGSVTLTVSSDLTAGACDQVSDEITITILPSPDVHIAVTNAISCYGDSDGVLSVIPTGSYNYEWNTNATTSEISGLSAGDYSVTITDNNGCITVSEITLDEPSEIEITLLPNSTTCHGGSDGSINTIVSGGSPSYSYLWDDPSNTPVPNPVNLTAGTYTVIVTDSNGCTAEQSAVVTEPDMISITIQSMPVVCGSSLGNALAVPNGGNGGYTYLWSNGANTAQTSNLTSGTYEVVVTDNLGCTASQTVSIGMQGGVSVSINVVSDISCFGDSDGALSASIGNGIEPYDILWSNSETTNTISNLSAGVYTVDVEDSWGCLGYASYTLDNPEEISLSFNVSDVDCYGDETGSATVHPDGGNYPYNYEWSNGNTTETIINQGAGTYSVIVIDNHGCSTTSSVQISQPETPINAEVEYSNVLCHGDSNGWISADATGGTAPYNYVFEINNQTINSSEITNLPQGVYQLYVTDDNNCIYQTGINISEPAPLQVDYWYQSPSCMGNNDGYIELLVNGGTSPYSYHWENGFSPVEYIEGLIEGSYIITVIDDNECSKEVGPINLVDVNQDCIQIPNAFTPNGDGINDEWIIENINLYPNAYIQVFNRWGQALYEGRGSDDPWDGKYNGEFVPAGSYIYIINLYFGGTTYHGVVTVVY